jgi:hypothetical protein
MLTGYNTDVNHDDLAFHVQTEDKGRDNPYIESLIYVGGQVLASKRTGYASILEQGKGKEAILAIMDHQHRSMISAIRAGTFDDKVAELLGGAQADQDHPGNHGNHGPAAGAGPERSLDEVILEYLNSEAQQDRLVLMLQEEVELAFGETALISVLATSSKTGRAAAGARIELKLISTAAEPRILATGRTDSEGRLRLLVQIPRIDQGSSALIITASSELGKTELKYLL